MSLSICMFIKEFIVQTSHERQTKLGHTHPDTGDKSFVLLRCDNCDTEVERPRGNMDPKRLNNNYFHVCNNCNAKKFAQKKGVERKQVWNMSASSGLPIGKL